jgi:hypothetical protein
MQGGRNKGFVSIPDVEKAEGEIRRWYYKGKPTRKYKRYLRLDNKFERNFIAKAVHLDERFKRFADHIKS